MVQASKGSILPRCGEFVVPAWMSGNGQEARGRRAEHADQALQGSCTSRAMLRRRSGAAASPCASAPSS